MRSRFNHSRQRNLPSKPIKPVAVSNIDTLMINVWAEQNDAREEKIWQKKMDKYYGRR